MSPKLPRRPPARRRRDLDGLDQLAILLAPVRKPRRSPSLDRSAGISIVTPPLRRAGYRVGRQRQGWASLPPRRTPRKSKTSSLTVVELCCHGKSSLSVLISCDRAAGRCSRRAPRRTRRRSLGHLTRPCHGDDAGLWAFNAARKCRASADKRIFAAPAGPKRWLRKGGRRVR